LRDPRDRKIFYVGQGTGNRVLNLFDKPTPNGLPYSAQPGCDLVNDPEFQKGIKRAHYIPTSEERPDLYLQGGGIQKTKDSVNQ
jgi:hypothetical protein